MRIFTILVLVSIFYSCQNSSSGYKPVVNLSEQLRPIDSFLKKGVFNVVYYASKQISDEDRVLLRKTAQLIKTNEHTSRFFDQLSKGEKPAFTNKIGITKKEFEQLTSFFAYEKPKQTRGKFQILQKGDVISFKGEGSTSVFDSVTISPFFDHVYFKSFALAYDSSDINVSATLLPDGDTLNDYRLFDGPQGLSGFLGFNGKYQFVIGRLQPSGRTYLLLNARRPDIMEHPIPEYCSIIIERD